jgi:oxygen-independent coproporphyrinogen III oxidase
MINHLYLHFPFCRHLCNYCDFYKKVPKDQQEHRDFEVYLLQSLQQLNRLISSEGESWGELSSIYIGGGTPSLWGVDGAKYLNELLAENNISLAKNCEFTLEVNPGSWTSNSIDAWRSIGVNRFSLGVQSLNSQFSRILDRVHSIDDVYDTLNYFKSHNDNFSVDFMLGLPFSKEWSRDIQSELEEICSFDPNHLSLYILTVPKHYIHYADLPDEDWVANEYLSVARQLKEKKFNHYEVSNFAKPGFESRHNLAYWQMKTVAALGPAATGYFSTSGHRYKWQPTQVNYQSEYLAADEKKLEKVYMSMRSQEGLLLDQLDGSRSDSLEKLLKKWHEQDYVLEHTKDKLLLNSKGYLVLDSLIDELFALKLL